jgi:hypothetical protein
MANFLISDKTTQILDMSQATAPCSQKLKKAEILA